MTLQDRLDAFTLPMPARYAIGTDGVIAYAQVNPDYTQRPDPSELLPVLDWLAARRAAARSSGPSSKTQSERLSS